MNDQAVRQVRDALAQLAGDHAREGADAQAALDVVVAALSEATARAEKAEHERDGWRKLATTGERAEAAEGRVRKLTEALEPLAAFVAGLHPDTLTRDTKEAFYDARAVLAEVASAERSNP